MQNHSDSSLNSTSWTTANLVSSSLMGLCFMIGVPCNIAVILFIVQHFKKDNFTINLMLNLAAADILCLITLPVWIYNHLYSWSIDQSSCKFFTVLVYCSAYSSVITVTILSVYRCLRIRRPQLWSRMSKRRERALLISGWVLALLFSCPGVLTQEIVQGESKKSCGRTLYSEEYRLTVAILEMLLAFFLPFTVILTSYCCLHQKVTQGAFSHRQKLTKLVTRIVVTFFIFYAPHQIMNVFQIFEIVFKSSLPVFSAKLHEIRSSTGDIARSLIFINSCVNSFLYAVASKTLRQQNWTAFQYKQRDMLFTEESFSSVNMTDILPLTNRNGNIKQTIWILDEKLQLHLTNAFILVLYLRLKFYPFIRSLGIKPMTFVLLPPCTVWAAGNYWNNC